MPRPPQSLAVFLTGARTGIGEAVARELIARGHRVWGTARRPEQLAHLAGLHPLALDFSRPETIQSAWEQAVREAGAIDVVIQNAGSGIFGPIEAVTRDQAREQWAVLVEGPLEVLRLAAAHLRPRRTGTIIGISSLAGEMPMPFFAHYSAGKAALSALLATLWMELKPFGVKVIDFRPGDIRTGFNDAVPAHPLEKSPYRPWAEQAWAESCVLLKKAPPPELVARSIAALLEKSEPPAMTRCGDPFQTVAGPLGAKLFSRSFLLQSIRSYYGLSRLDLPK